MKQEAYRSTTLNLGSRSSIKMNFVTEGETKIDVMLEEKKMYVQQQIYMDLVHSIIYRHMTHRSRGSHMEIDSWEQEAPTNVGLSTIDVHSFDDHEQQLASNWSHGRF